MDEPRIARRLRAPSWRDGRLLVGILLILGSVALGVRVVDSASQRDAVFAAARPLVAGERLAPGHLTRVEVDLGAATSGYLSAEQPEPDDAVVVRDVRAGELVPASALGHPDAQARRPVMVPVSSETARVLTIGSVVDVWVSDKATDGAGTSALPRRLVEAASVARAPGPEELRMAASTTVGVQVMVPPEDIDQVIAAVDNGGRITLVPVAGSLQREE